MLFHTLVGKLQNLELIHYIDAISHIGWKKLQNLELIHYIDAISHIGWKIAKFS